MKTSSKRLLIILSVLAIIILLIVLNSTVFTLKKVEVNFYNTQDQLIEDNNTLTHFNEESIDDIIDSAKFKFGKTIFLIKKQPYINRLELKNPYLKVISITARFPNKLVIKVAEREVLYATPLANSKYALLDGELKVLEIVDSIDAFSCVVVDLELDTLQAGTFVKGEKQYSILKQFAPCMQVCTFNTQETIALVESVSLEYGHLTGSQTEQGYWLNIKTRTQNKEGSAVAGVSLRIEDSAKDLEDKLYKAWVAYNTLLTSDVSKTQSGTITVTYDNTGDTDYNVVWTA